jgi:hypothetical protein
LQQSLGQTAAQKSTAACNDDFHKALPISRSPNWQLELAREAANLAMLTGWGLRSTKKMAANGHILHGPGAEKKK